MKKIFLALLLLPSTLFAQVHGQIAGKGVIGSQSLGVVTDCATAINGAAGTWGRFAVDEDGNICTAASISTTGLATSAKQDTMITSLQLLDDVVATDGSAVLTKSFQVAGTDGTNAQTLSVTTTGAAIISDGSGALNVIVDSITAGNNNIGDVDVASIAVGDNNIGNVDVLSQIPGTGATNLGKAEDGAHTSTDTGVAILGVRTDTPAASGANNDYSIVNQGATGGLYVDLDLRAQGSAANTPIKAEDAAHTTADAGVSILGVRTDTPAASGANNDYSLINQGATGGLYVDLDARAQGSAANTPIRLEDTAFAGASAVMTGGSVRNDVPTADAADLDIVPLKSNNTGALYNDGIRRGTFTHVNPSVNTATSTSLVASNTARRYLFVQNNSGANICISLDNATLTGIVPSNTNPCIVLTPGAAYESPPSACPTAAITGYQTSGGTITTITTIEAS